MTETSSTPTPVAPWTDGCPSGLAPPAARDDSAVSGLSAFVRRKGSASSLSLLVRGAKCAGCLAKIERNVAALPGVDTARLNLSTGRLDVAWTGALDAERIAATLTGLGYGVAPYEPGEADTAARAEERSLLIAMGVAGFATANIMLLSVSVWAGHGEMGETTRTLMHWVSALIALPVIAFCGRVFFRSAWAALRAGHANMDVPISLALVLATAVSLYATATHGEHAYFDAAVMLCFFLLIGRYLDARLRRRAHAAAHELAALQGATATRLTAGGVTETVRASEIRPDDLLLLATGERASVDMVLTEGESELDESLVSGESAPRPAVAGATVFAGTVNLGRPVRGRALAAAEDSLMADIARMLEAGEQKRSAYRRIADRAVSLYVPLVHTIAALTCLGWLLAGQGAEAAIFTAVATLIITCPCALALAAPVVQVVAAGRLFRNGVYLKSGDALERLAGVDHVVFDKTGTLTLGRPDLILDPDVEACLEQAAALARISRHPLSRAVVAAAGPGRVAEDVTEHAGLGLEGWLDGERLRLGSADWVEVPDARRNEASLWFARGRAAPVALRFEDRLHADARSAIETLRARGLSVEIVSGDRESAVAEIARALGIDTYTAAARPGDKTDRLETLAADGRKVLMVGDGLNDAGALALAHASLAPGGAMDVSRSASDAVYSGEGLSPIVTILSVAGTARRRMLQNFGLAALYNLIAVPIAVAGLVTPLVAAVAMSASSVVVTLNALRPSHGDGTV